MKKIIWISGLCFILFGSVVFSQEVVNNNAAPGILKDQGKLEAESGLFQDIGEKNMYIDNSTSGKDKQGNNAAAVALVDAGDAVILTVRGMESGDYYLVMRARTGWVKPGKQYAYHLLINEKEILLAESGADPLETYHSPDGSWGMWYGFLKSKDKISLKNGDKIKIFGDVPYLYVDYLMVQKEPFTASQLLKLSEEWGQN